jgi:hypothetical protein
MKSLKWKFASWITMYTAGILIVSALVYGYASTNLYLSAFPFLLAFFYLFGFVGVSVYDWSLKHKPAQTAMYYLVVRIAKFMISLAGALIYCWADKKNAVVFLITYLIIYLLYLIFETGFYYRYEMEQKQKSMNK